jgi:L-rhamnose mutarotase
MIRKASIMHVNADAHAEYQRRHEELWPAMAAVLKAHGVHNYSIFLNRARNLLFAYVEVESEARWAAIAETGECREWWVFMRDVMKTNPDNSPVSEELAEVFHLD